VYARLQTRGEAADHGGGTVSRQIEQRDPVQLIEGTRG
jgi:hypothetical protein